MMKIKLIKRASIYLGKPQTEILLEADSIELMEQLTQIVKKNFDI